MGSKVGPYIVTSTLGQGTFGKVKLAQHQETGIEYAIKILDKSDIKANELTLNVRREIAIMKALNHKNIVNLREVLSSKSKLYIVMDLVRGGELFEQIERRGELDTKLARKYFQQLVDGIDYCHRRGVYHRDLKPENLLIDDDGTLKITDFGVSSMKGGVTGSDLLLYTACGTPYYCAPEIINSAEDGYSGVKIDAWSCGIILYLLLTGMLPFQNEDINKLYELISQRQVDFPTWMSDDAKDLIGNLLKKNPGARYSLEDVKRHPWFLVDYETQPSESSRFSNGGVSARTSNGSSSSPSTSKESRRPSRGNSKGRRSYDKESRRNSDGRRSSDSSTSGGVPPPIPAAAEPEKPTLKDVSQYADQELSVLIKASLPGKPARRIEQVVSQLEELDIECVEDLSFLSSTLKTPDALTAWLEEKSKLPSITCMRIAQFFFS